MLALALVTRCREAAAFSAIGVRGGAVISLRCQGSPLHPQLPTRRNALVVGAGVIVLGGGEPVWAQKPPPRPKVTSVPLECKQAGGCAMDDDMNAGMAKFKSAG